MRVVDEVVWWFGVKGDPIYSRVAQSRERSINKPDTDIQHSHPPMI
jgi:hypothetical protein